MIQLIKTLHGVTMTVSPASCVSKYDLSELDFALRTLAFVMPKGVWTGYQWATEIRAQYENKKAIYLADLIEEVTLLTPLRPWDEMTMQQKEANS